MHSTHAPHAPLSTCTAFLMWHHVHHVQLRSEDQAPLLSTTHAAPCDHTLLFTSAAGDGCAAVCPVEVDIYCNRAASCACRYAVRARLFINSSPVHHASGGAMICNLICRRNARICHDMQVRRHKTARSTRPQDEGACASKHKTYRDTRPQDEGACVHMHIHTSGHARTCDMHTHGHARIDKHIHNAGGARHCFRYFRNSK